MKRKAREIESVTSNTDLLELFQQHRGLLFSIAYRMLGSVADAEDMLQEAFIRWRGTEAAEIQSPRAFLVTIVSRLCINYLESARVKREQYVGQWLPEPLLTAPAEDATSHIDESLSMAFLVVLERLNAVERAVFLLHEVFDYDYAEIARILSLTEANCRQILRRARRHIADVRPRFDPSPERRERLLHEFVEASTRGDMKGLLKLLSDDVVLHSDGGGKAAAVPNLIYGSERVARFVFGALRKFVPQNVVRRVVPINGQPGLVNYHHGSPLSVLTMDVRDGRIRAIYVVSNPEKLERLPLLQ
jgi:RNA polymerase sigma-70 factor (ECF subfamily)